MKVGTATAQGKSVNEWFVFPKAIPKKTCNKIIRLGKEAWEDAKVDVSAETSEEDRIFGRKQEFGVKKKTRISEVVWLQEQWLYDLVWPLMLEANQNSGWRYDITAAEPQQLTRYRAGVNGHYSWHQDGQGDHMSKYDCPENPLLHGKVRKLTAAVSLNDTFKGGVFEFSTYGRGECHVVPPVDGVDQGNVLVFPGTLEHRVPPVTKGVRYSLITWFVGPPFR